MIIDTDVVAAGLITSRPDSPTAQILDGMINGRLVFLLSPALLDEYRQILLRPKLVRRHGLTEPEVVQILTEITANAIWRDPPADTDHLSPDLQDSHLWALLASEPAAVLITGDHLLIEKPRPRRSVISPAAWLAHFAGRPPDSGGA
ncbi:putative toxin-antitoxin system toxin component, PIN family [Desulfotignum balticum]|uniref:putative toxin-antitoxin system toxin component, PIN family n=1 Tax=Desulfotignum balticum TaxID=115781 RepID=UPI000414574D|nr:putative toxin-antitoxin system toxin component, PIN family [Desulfotignum balticum]